MPLPQELLNEIKERIDEARQRRQEVQDVIDDLRASGIDVLAHTEHLKDIDAQLRQLSTFLSRQEKRIGG